MAMLKVLARRGSAKRVMEYLAKDGRAVAFESSFAAPGEDWSATMDDVARELGRGGKRSYYHVVISPDPRDGLDVDAAMGLATRWVAERYPEAMWVAEAHDDTGIPHVHVIVGATLPASGRKIHMDNDWVREDARALQRICRELGMSALPDEPVRRDEDGAEIGGGSARRRAAEHRERQRRVRSERAARGERPGGSRRSSKGSWLDDVRDEIDRAIVGCRTWAELAERLEADGYGVRLTRRRGAGVGVTFTHPRERVDKSGGWRVKGWKLDREGGAYSYAGLLSRLGADLGSLRALDARVPRPPVLRSYEDRLAARAASRRGIDVQDIADACAWVRAQGVTTSAAARARAEEIVEAAALAAAAEEEARSWHERAMEAEALAGSLGPDADPERRAEAVEGLGRLGLAADPERVSEAAEEAAEIARRRSAEARMAEQRAASARQAVRVMRTAGMFLEEESDGERAARAGAAGSANRVASYAPVVISAGGVEAGLEALRHHQTALEAERERRERAARRRSYLISVGVRRAAAAERGRDVAGGERREPHRSQRGARR